MRVRHVLPSLALAAALGAGCQAPPAGPPAEILWDTWGVPHVFSDSAEGVAFALGWAQAEAHGDLVLRLYGEARGRAAEYRGEEHLAGDELVRTLGFPARAEQWYAEQPEEMQALLDAFAAGFNEHARRHPERLGEDARRVLPVEPSDVLAHAQRVFHLVFLAGDSAAERREWREERGSNAWAVAPRRSASGDALLLANPHLPWSGVFTFFEAHLVAPGLDAYGATLVGFPFLGIAFNERIAWTHTVNPLDGADLYELTLRDGGYEWDGEVRSFETSVETLRVRRADGSLEERRLEVRRSVHGPVVEERDGRALALRIAGLDQPHLMQQYWEMMRAGTLSDFEAALGRLQMPLFNAVYADAEGRILYAYSGRVPLRSGGRFEDWRGVVPGARSDTLWLHTLPYRDLPRVYDPATGWVQNANDPPWTSTIPPVLDGTGFKSYLAPTGMGFRPQRSARMLAGDESIGLDELIAYKHSTRSELADRVLDELATAARRHGPEPARRAAGVLEAWDRQTLAESRGALLFEAWVEEAGADSLFAEPWSLEEPLATPRQLRDPAAAAAALARAAERVERERGALDVAWGEVHRLRLAGKDLPANGGPGGLGIFRVAWFEDDADGLRRIAGGDSWVAAVELSSPVRARVLLAYGNASQPGSPHRGDQLELFARQELREAWLTRAEIEAHLESRTALP